MSEPLLVWFNGELMASAGAASVDVNESYLLDRANSFGDGIFGFQIYVPFVVEIILDIFLKC